MVGETVPAIASAGSSEMKKPMTGMKSQTNARIASSNAAGTSSTVRTTKK